ncbi:MAG: hypothetical protein JOY81_01165 [Alphaproteobacteria bacterium]|nr:hypothetical protein [Alphaproteobacteria bacterium]
MDIKGPGPQLPGHTLIYREYEALLPCGERTMIAVTLDALWDASGTAAAARASGPTAYGHVLVLDSECELPIIWTYDGIEIHIAASPAMAAGVRTDLREAIGGFVLHFIEAVGQEMNELLGSSSSIH